MSRTEITPRMQPKERKAQLLAAALKAAESHGYNRVTLQQVADAAGVTKTLVVVYFGTMANLRRDVMRAAVRESCKKVIAQGIVCRDPHALKAPAAVRQAALAALS